MTNRVARRCLTRKNFKMQRIPYKMKKYRHVPNLEILHITPYINYTFCAYIDRTLPYRCLTRKNCKMQRVPYKIKKVSIRAYLGNLTPYTFLEITHFIVV